MGDHARRSADSDSSAIVVFIIVPSHRGIFTFIFIGQSLPAARRRRAVRGTASPAVVGWSPGADTGAARGSGVGRTRGSLLRGSQGRVQGRGAPPPPH